MTNENASSNVPSSSLPEGAKEDQIFLSEAGHADHNHDVDGDGSSPNGSRRKGSSDVHGLVASSSGTSESSFRWKRPSLHPRSTKPSSGSSDIIVHLEQSESPSSSSVVQVKSNTVLTPPLEVKISPMSSLAEQNANEEKRPIVKGLHGQGSKARGDSMRITEGEEREKKQLQRRE